MPITKPTRPEFVASGVVVAVVPRRAYDRENGRYTGEVIGHEVTLSQQTTGAQFAVRVGIDRETGKSVVPVPQVLTAFNVVTELSESREYGVSLTVIRPLDENDVDRLHSALVATA